MHIESLDINKIFQNTGNSEELQPKDYSFLNKNNIYQSIKMVKAMLNYTQHVQATQKDHNEVNNLLHLVSFKPHRILLQEIAIQFTVYAAIHKIDKNDRDVYILTIYRNIILSMEPLISSHNEFCELYNDKYRKIKQKYTAPGAYENFPELLNIKKICEKVMVNCKGLSPTKLAIGIIVSQEYNTTVRKDIRNYTKFKIFEFINSTRITPVSDTHPLKLRISAPIKERNILFIVGGPGSGKTSYSKQLKQNLENLIGNFVEINTDSYKHLLMPPPLTPKLMLGYSQLIQTEASFIKYQALKLAIKENMHILIDQVSFSKDILEEKKLQKGIIRVIVMSSKINTALERNQIRGIGGGRFEDTYGILNKHKNTVIEVVNNISILLTAKYKNATVIFQDNSSLNHQEPRVFMEINCTKKQIIIKNEDLLKQFFKNKFLYIPPNTTDTLDQTIVHYEKTDKELIEAVDEELFNFIKKVRSLGGTVIQASGSVSNTITSRYSTIISTCPSSKSITAIYRGKLEIQSKDYMLEKRIFVAYRS